MALSPTSVATAVAGLSVSGVTVKDLTGVPEEVFDRDCPIVYPNPANYVSMGGVSRETMGGDSGALKEVRYTLHYLFLHHEAGAERGQKDAAQDAVSKLYAFLSAVIANCDALTVIDITPDHGPLQVVQDPSGKDFHGCEVSLAVTEWLNA